MINKIHTLKSQIAILLLMSLSSVFLCDYLCDFEILSIRQNCRTSCALVENDDHHDHSSIETHHDPVKSDHHSQKNESEAPKTNHNHEDECCEDLTSFLYASFFNEKSSAPVIDVKLHFLFEIGLPAQQLNIYHLVTKIFTFYGDLSPPLKGYTIRKLIQSFLL